MTNEEEAMDNRLKLVEKRLRKVEDFNKAFAIQVDDLDTKIDSLSNTVDKKLDDVMSGNDKMIDHLNNQDRESRRTNEMLLKSIIDGQAQASLLAEQAKVRDYEFKRARWKDVIGILSTSLISGGIIYMIIEGLVSL